MEIIKNYTLNIEKLNANAEIFEEYAKAYDLEDIEISGKLYHTFRVAKMSKELAKELGLNFELAYNIGLLHDYARFEQWSRFHTFSDHKSIDHADFAVELLFEDNQIKRFNIKREDYLLIKLAIIFHNKLNVNLNYIKTAIKEDKTNKHSYEDIVTYCKLIRDADKLDIFNRIGNGDVTIYETENGYTPRALESIKSHNPVLYVDVHTKLDRLFVDICYLFDINFNQSLLKINLENYLNSLVINYGNSLNKTDIALLKDVMADILKYFKTKLKG